MAGLVLLTKVILIDSSKVCPAGIDPDQDLLTSVQTLPDPDTSAEGVDRPVRSSVKCNSTTQLSMSSSGVISIVISMSWPLLTTLVMISSQPGKGGRVVAGVVVVSGAFVVVVVVVVVRGGPPQMSCPLISAKIR